MFNSTTNANDEAISSALNNPEQQLKRKLDGFGSKQLYGFPVRPSSNADDCNHCWRNCRYKPAPRLNTHVRVKSECLV